MKLSEMSNEELDAAAAVEVMGWHDAPGYAYLRDDPGPFNFEGGGLIEPPRVWASSPGMPSMLRQKDWRPTTDRNHSLTVRSAAYAKTDAPLDPSFDPREEVIDSIEAVRAFTSAGTQGESVEITGGNG